MTMADILIEFFLLGVVGGLLGLFYRNCLKPENMIFNWWYYKVLKPWAEVEDDLNENECISMKPTKWQKFLAFIAYPLGYCIYCSTTWITFFLVAIYLSAWTILPDWQTIVIGTLFATGVQHLIVVCACRWIIHKHPDNL